MSTTKQTNKDLELNGVSDVNSVSKIDAIKQIIFGENIAAYNSEFEHVKSEIIAKKKELENLIEATKIELNESLDTLGTDINIRITELEDRLNEKSEELASTKVNKEVLSRLFIKLGEKLNE